MEVVGQLTGAIAHDFNNLLTIILTNLHVLDERLDDAVDPEIGELLDDAASAARDAAGLTRRLLAFSRRQPLEPQWMDLDVFVEHTCRFLRRVTGEGIELVVQRGDGPLPVHVDRQQLENTLLNLAINARDAMPDGGTLTIEARRQWIGADESALHPRLPPGNYAVVSIADTGVGMSPGGGAARRRALLFDQADGQGQWARAELGVGVRPAVGRRPQHPQRTRPGHDRLAVPAGGGTARAGETRRKRAPQGASQGSATVLVVDDERRLRRLARRTLSDLGYQVLEAENAAAAPVCSSRTSASTCCSPTW